MISKELFVQVINNIRKQEQRDIIVQPQVADFSVLSCAIWVDGQKLELGRVYGQYEQHHHYGDLNKRRAYSIDLGDDGIGVFSMQVDRKAVAERGYDFDNLFRQTFVPHTANPDPLFTPIIKSMNINGVELEQKQEALHHRSFDNLKRLADNYYQLGKFN